MPVYQYRNLRTGVVFEEVRPVDMRDACPPECIRIRVPVRVTVCTGAPPKRQADAVMKGFRQVEEQKGLGAIERACGMTAEQIKRVWSEPVPGEQPCEV